MAQTKESGDKTHWGVASVRSNGDIDTDGGVVLSGNVTAVDVTASGNVSGVNVTASGDLITATKTPASASATGTAGTVAWDGSYIYICSATDTWLRVGIATW